MTTIDEFVAALPRKRMGAGMLFSDGPVVAGAVADGSCRVLLVDPVYKDLWEVPGGIVEADESPFAAATREIKEELDLDVTPGRLLVADWVPAQPHRPDALLFIFDGGILHADRSAEIHLQAEELQAWAWVPVGQLTERLSPLLARRVAAAVAAKLGGTTAYLEYGNLVA